MQQQEVIKECGQGLSNNSQYIDQSIVYNLIKLNLIKLFFHHDICDIDSFGCFFATIIKQVDVFPYLKTRHLTECVCYYTI